jgi:N4-gp56 family major capsid protein
MAQTTYGVNDASTVKVWSKKVAEEALKATPIAPLIGETEDSIIYRKTELKKSAGDRITCNLFMNLNGDGFTEAQVMEGNEEALTNFTDNLFINELHNAAKVPNKGTIDEQRVPFPLRNLAKSRLVKWYAKRMSVSFFNQACGYTPQTDTRYTGLNAVIAPSASRIIRANSAATDEALTSADTFDLRLVDFAKEMADTADPQIQPIMFEGEEKYVMYLHPFQVTDLRTNTSTGQWLDITKAVYQGAKQKNPIYSGALGEYNQVILRKAYDVTQGVHSVSGAAETDVRRAVLLGAQAAIMASGGFNEETEYEWVEELFDYKRWLGVAVKSIFGLKKSVYNSLDYGTVVVSTFGQAHT